MGIDDLVFPSGAHIFRHPDEASWHAYRAERIGGSDMAALYGVSRYSSPYSVWCEKNPAIRTEREANDAMRWGTWVERGIAQGYASTFGVALYDLGRFTTVQHPTIPWMYATLDFVADDPAAGMGCVETKNVDVSKADEWEAGTIGSGGVAPLPYQIQGQQQMAVTGLGWCDLFALIGGNRGVRVRMLRDEGFVASMVQRGNEMMRRIRENDPPEPDGHEATKSAQRMRWPEHVEGAAVVLPESFAALLAERARLDDEAKRIAAERSAIESWIVEQIGDRQYGLVPGFGRVSSVAPNDVPVKAHVRRTKRSFRFPSKPNPEKTDRMIRELRESSGEPVAICDAKEES